MFCCLCRRRHYFFRVRRYQRCRHLVHLFAPLKLMSTTPSSSSQAGSRLRPSRHSLKQLKFVLPGGLVTYLFDTINRLILLLAQDGESGVKVSGWTRWGATIPCVSVCRSLTRLLRTSAQISVLSGVLTIGLFLYILLLPWFRGVQPNVST